MTELDVLPEDDRSVELSSIAAIYPEIHIDPASPFRASLDLPVKPSTPLRVCFHPYSDAGFPTVLTPPGSLDVSDSGLGSGSKSTDENLPVGSDKDVHALTHLPPIALEVELPERYPSEQSPLVKISTNPPWLPTSIVNRLVDDCVRLWEECGRDMVVYTYIDHLQQLSETAFGIDDIPDGEVRLPRELKIALLDFNSKAERENFEQETFECGVCLEPKKGANCYRLLGCGHVFCIPCLQDFYNNCITEGDVDSVKCLAPDCGKEQSAAATPENGQKRKKHGFSLSPSELLQIPLDQETVQRYVFLKRKKKLEADKSTVYCPRKWCQGAARSKRHPKPTDPMTDDIDGSDEEEEAVAFDPLGEEAQLPPMADRVAICEDCNYAFCSVCKKGWHGELVRCFPRREAELSAEEKATEEYLKRYTSPCPTCNAPCQKRMGCNHMKCFKCDTHFCYLCSSWLSEDNPYQHYNTLNGGCYNRLWDLEGGDGPNPDGAAILHQIPADLLDDASDDDDDDDDRIAWDFHEQMRRQRPPPPAPAPPLPHGPRGLGRRDRGRALDAAGRAAAAERQAQARAMAEVRGRPEREGELDARQHAALQHFLDLVINDREDEWDSDELDDEF